jgi:hypothetical protein
LKRVYESGSLRYNDVIGIIDSEGFESRRNINRVEVKKELKQYDERKWKRVYEYDEEDIEEVTHTDKNYVSF